MEPKTLVFDKEFVNKNSFHSYKKPIGINKVDIRYITDDGIIPLYLEYPQMNAHVKYFNKSSIHMNILVHNKKILKKTTIKYEIKLQVYLKKNLIVNRCIKRNTLKLK